MPAVAAMEGVFRPTTDGYINRRVGSQRRATVLSIRAMVTSFVLAALAPTMGWLVDHQGLDYAYYTCAGLSLAAVVVLGRPLLSRGRPTAAIPGADISET